MPTPTGQLNVDFANPWNHTSPLARRFRGFWTFLPGYESGAVVPELVTWGTRRFDVPLVSVSNSPGATSGIMPGNSFYPFPSLKLPGSTSYAVQAVEDSWTEVPRNLGLCAWVYTAADSTQRTIFGKFAQTGHNRSYMLDILNTNVLRALWSYDGINSLTVSSAAVTAGWYFVGASINQSTAATASMRIFVGSPGQRVRLSGSGNSTVGAIFDGTTPISIGAMSNTNGAFFWKGQIGACGLVDGVPNEDEWDLIAKEGWNGFPTMLNRIGDNWMRSVPSGTTYSLSTSLGVAGSLVSSPVNVVVTAATLAAALSEAQAAVNNVVAGLSLSQSVLASLGASNSSVSATALSAGSSLSPSSLVQSSITGQLSVAVSASVAANLITSISITAAVSVAEPANAAYPPILLSSTMSVATSITDQLVNAAALYETNAVNASFTESLRNQVAATELLAAFAGLSESQTLQLATSIALATEEIVDALLAKISSDAVAMGASVSEAEALTLEMSEQIAIELLAAFQALLTDGAPQVLVDLIRLVTDRWTRSDIIDEDFEAGQRL